MTRAGLEDLEAPIPIGSMLPGIYQRFDTNVLDLTAVLDEVLAPIWAVLDCYDAYIDPALAPFDFLDLLAEWVGLAVDRNWNEEQTRCLVARAVELYRWRGTKRGLADLVEAYIGVKPSDITDSGGVVWSSTPGAAAPGEDLPAVRIDIVAPKGVAIDRARLVRLLQSSVPAHVLLSVDLRHDGGKKTAADPAEPVPAVEAPPVAEAPPPLSPAVVPPPPPSIEPPPFIAPTPPPFDPPSDDDLAEES